jgi:hypothetical protein
MNFCRCLATVLPFDLANFSPALHKSKSSGLRSECKQLRHDPRLRGCRSGLMISKTADVQISTFSHDRSHSVSSRLLAIPFDQNRRRPSPRMISNRGTRWRAAGCVMAASRDNCGANVGPLRTSEPYAKREQMRALKPDGSSLHSPPFQGWSVDSPPARSTVSNPERKSSWHRGQRNDSCRISVAVLCALPS